MRLLHNISIGFCLFITACTSPLPTEVAESYEKLPDKIDFNFHVRPILSEHCFSCHGPDEANREAGLRLDLPEEAYRILEESGNIALVPHKPEQSESYKRVLSTDPEYQMPPPAAKVPITDLQKATLVKWIEQGAEYKDHWAFVKPKPGKIPKNKHKEAKNEIDNFVFVRLEQENLKPSARATKETLIRRIAFDLTGLPPSLEQVDMFLADDSPQAYEKVLDQFLATEAYGERMAAYWMEVARYADSDGYLDDKHRDFSPWRDWVIQAFNQNMPYDSFVSLQVAGDLLPHATKEQVLPTAFNRLHKKNSEAGIDLEEFRVEYVADKTHTFAKAFLGLTLECARCHTHKYDPISHEDYYSMFAFFNQTNEIGHAVYGPDITPGPALLLTDVETEAKIAFLQKKIAASETEAKGLENTLFEKVSDRKSANISPKEIRKHLDEHLEAYYPFDQTVPKPNAFHSANKANPKTPARIYEPELKAGYKGKALFNSDYSTAYLGEKVGWFERTEPFSVDFYLFPDTLYEEASVFIHAEDWRLGNKGYSLYLKDNHLQFLMAHAFPANAIQLTTVATIPAKKWSHISLSYDGSSRAAGLTMYIDGKKAQTTVEVDNLYKGILYVPNIHTYGFNGFQLGKRDGVLPMDGGGIDELRIYSKALTALEVLYLHDKGAVENLGENPGRQKTLLAEWNIAHSLKKQQINRELKLNREALNELVNEIPEIMVMQDLPETRPTFVLNRGVYDDHAQQVSANTPDAIMAFPEDLPRNRLGLAKWLFHPDNPLTARVMVNRIWEMHFGKGLVKTQEDFGNQGALPTHPELLDWLAIWFQESGWDIKALHRLIMSSETYQQSSVITKEQLARDPENDFLARGARFRLSAEMIRDNALAISGLLVEKMGGPSVYPYQPEGLWDEISNKHWRYPYLQEPGEGLYRRSLYTVWKRTAPPPAMLLLDANDRSNCTVQRTNTSTPLQALLLLNDPQYLEAARVLAEKALLQLEVPGERIAYVFRMVTGRHPDQEELKTLEELYKKEHQHFEQHKEDAIAYLEVGEKERKENNDPIECAALAVVVNALMNTDEAYTRK